MRQGWSGTARYNDPLGPLLPLQAQVTRLEISLPIKGSTCNVQEKYKSSSAFFSQESHGGEGDQNACGWQGKDKPPRACLAHCRTEAACPGQLPSQRS